MQYGDRPLDQDPPRWACFASGLIVGLVLSWLQYAAWVARAAR